MAQASKSAKIRKWLLVNPGVSNSHLYLQFPDTPKSSLRRIAASIKEVREKRKLFGSTEYQGLLYAPKVKSSVQWGRKQLSVSRKLRHGKMTVPLSEDAIEALKSVFVEADELQRRENFQTVLSAYSLVVEIAREGKLNKSGKITPKWSGEFITIPGRLTKVGPRELWTAFEDHALERINNFKRGEALVRAEIVAHSKSDPLFVRPARLTVYMHAKIDKQKK